MSLQVVAVVMFVLALAPAIAAGRCFHRYRHTPAIVAYGSVRSANHRHSIAWRNTKVYSGLSATLGGIGLLLLILNIVVPH